ncbi:hypothetical protein BDZ97DRAFT_771059 [Flammula alnicola]|nr:hypothetical protein BDZ97DRAFT_771059 [Flammula alnicola]
MKDLLPHIEWLPSIAVEFTEHRQFVLGVAMGAGLDVGDEINDTGHAHVVEKGLDARSRGRKARIATETIDPKDLARVFEELTDFYKEPPNVSMTELMEGEDLFEFFSPDGDIGVTGWKDKSAEELSNLLGFDDGRPPLFAKYRALDATVNSWNSPRLVDWNGVGGDGVRPLSLQWHQLCGIASMADKTFTASDPKSEGYSPSTNILLADDVGLGKTGQIMGMIAFLVSVWFVESQQGNKSRPHVINSATGDERRVTPSTYPSPCGLCCPGGPICSSSKIDCSYNVP